MIHRFNNKTNKMKSKNAKKPNHKMVKRSSGTIFPASQEALQSNIPDIISSFSTESSDYKLAVANTTQNTNWMLIDWSEEEMNEISPFLRSKFFDVWVFRSHQETFELRDLRGIASSELYSKLSQRNGEISANCEPNSSS
jgi:hypothetical protein